MRNSNSTSNIIQQLQELHNILQARIDAIDNLLEVLNQESIEASTTPHRQQTRRQQALSEGKARARAWAQEHLQK
jgi:hypothetical protein